MPLNHKKGYSSIVELIRNEDIYPGACICMYNGKYFPSVNRVRKIYGASAANHAQVIQRPVVREALSQSFLNI